MPVAVEIPTRVRADLAALLDPSGDALVADAVRSAAERALATSAEVVLGGDGARPVLVEPWFTWFGDGLGTLDVARRESLEASMTGALASAVSAADVRAPDKARGAAGELEIPSEPADPSRHAQLLRRYVLASYDDGDRQAAEVISFEDTPVRAGDGGFVEALGTPGADWTDDDWKSWFLLMCRELGQGVPASGVVGFLYQEPDGSYGIQPFHVTAISEDGVDFIGTGGTIRDLWDWQLDDQGRAREVPVTVPARGNVFLRALRETPTPESRIELKAERARRQLTAAFDAERERLIGVIGEAEFEELRRATVERIAAETTEEASVVGYVDLVVNGRDHLVTLEEPFGLPEGAVVPLVPYTEFVTEEPPKSGEGGEARGEGAPGAGPGVAERGGRLGGEGEAAEGGYVAVPGEAGAEDGALFPVVPGGDRIFCAPYLEEPRLSELGEDGAWLGALIERIAAKLAIEPCEYAGGFALMAAAAFAGRASDIGEFSVGATDAFLEPPPSEGTGNVGSVEFRPAPSPAIAYMRHLAGIAPELRRLVEGTADTYRKPEHRGKIGSFEDPISWVWRFFSEMNGAMGSAAGVMFGMTCRVLLLQLLRSSAKQLEGRLSQIDAYADLFEQALLPRLRKVDELIELRDQLRDAGTTPPSAPSTEALPGGVILPGEQVPTGVSAAGPGDAGVPVAGTPDPIATGEIDEPTTSEEARGAWQQSRSELTDALAGPDAGTPGATTTTPPPDTPARGTVVWTDPRGPRIHDGTGRAWSMLELEAGITTRRGWIESLDPLVKQLVDLDEVLQRFDDPERGVHVELEALLTEMLENNREQTSEVEDSWMYAFRASRINESVQRADVPYTSYQLGGIHLQAHMAIADAFEGDGYYALGINWLFAVELGRRGILNFFEFTGTLLLAIACPPLGAAVGIALAAYHLEEAEEKEQLYESLIDPELVITRAEVEQELFVARLGFALSVIPEAGTILRGATKLGGAVVRSGVRVGPRRAGRALGAYLAEETVKSLQHGLVRAFLREIVTDQAVEAVAQRVLEPIVSQIERETTITGPVGGEAGAERVLERLAAEAGVLGLPAPEAETETEAAP
jgi:hypothetical protein